MISKQEKSGMDSPCRLVSAPIVVMFWLAICVVSASAQTSGNSSLSGIVADPTGAVTGEIAGIAAKADAPAAVPSTVPPTSNSKS